MKNFYQIAVDTEKNIKNFLPEAINPKACKARYDRLYQANRKRRIKCTLNENELKQIEEFAKDYGKPKAEILKKAAFATINGQNLLSTQMEKEIQNLTIQIRKIGVNINQIATKANKFGKITNFLNLHKEIERLREIEKYLKIQVFKS